MGRTGDETLVPRQLPARPPVFVGRIDELKALDAVEAGIAVVGGPGGFGKTSLAVRWACDNAARFPGGQLYVNLRGFDPAASPVVPTVVLRGFLDALGVAPERIPDDAEARGALFRGLVADRRMLVVLDNARDEDQVRPLLPGGADSLVIVTSRTRMPGLVAFEQAQPLTVPVLAEDEAVALLAHRLGADRLGDTEAVEELVRRSGGMPLTLAVVAARALANPAFPLRALAGELRHEHLDSAFSGSYKALPDDAAALFRLLGVHCGPDIDVRAAGALLGGEARTPLAELTKAHLVEEHVPGRFRLHDLIRAFAAGLAADTRPALQRMLDHYLHTAFAAERLLAPHWPSIDVDTEKTFDGYEEALAWLDAELPVLLAATELAVREGFDVHAWQLPWTMSTFLYRSGRWDDRAATQHLALAAAGRLGDRTAEAVTLHLLGRGKAMLGDHAGAQADLARALALHEGDTVNVGVTHFSIAWSHAMVEDYGTALKHAQKALEQFITERTPSWIALIQGALGWLNAMAGDLDAALDHSTEALHRLRVLGDLDGEAYALRTLGHVHHRQGEHDRAAVVLSLATDQLASLGERYGEAQCADDLGDALSAAGDHEGAHRAWSRAAALLTRLGHPDLEGVQSKLIDTGVTGRSLET
ncbi:NB-ARC domain-containing protein [Lentzea sp. NPDC058450]|uniref:NB-ARC domain-containing protein n=1 Tax=Lentzea sp. NPDC058450 TaxID=3346505 RepID=UPI0036512709